MVLFEFIASRIPYEIFSYVLRQILSSFTNTISGVQMDLSLKYQVAIQLCCLVFLLCVDYWDLIQGTDVPGPAWSLLPHASHKLWFHSVMNCLPQPMVSALCYRELCCTYMS